MTTRIYDAFHAHANMNLTEVKVYGIDSIPSVTEVVRKMPCVVPLLGDTAGAPGFSIMAVSAGQGDMTLTPAFLLIVQKPETERPQQIPKAVFAAFEAYFNAIRADPDLGGKLDQDIVLSPVQFGVFDWAGASWAGAKITHTWEFLIG